MQYTKKIMKMSALIEENGFTKTYLKSLVHLPGQDFAWKQNPLKRNSPWVFDTEKFEKHRIGLIKLSKIS